MDRPKPPIELLEGDDELFAPSTKLAEWVSATFIDETAALRNEDHDHLRAAHIGYLWTNVGNSRKGRTVVGMAELGDPQGAMGKWSKARARLQVEQWFGTVPDFIMTLDANYCAQCSDDEFCALVEHELYHMAQERDMFGAPKFSAATGKPVFGMRGHDVEEFVGVVRCYGADAAGVRAMVDAANAGPESASVRIAQACGTCRLRVA